MSEKMTDYIRIYESSRGRLGNPDPHKTFSAFQKNAGLSRRALALAKEMYEADIAKNSERYLPNIAMEMNSKIKANYQAAVQYTKRELESNLEEVLTSKRNQIRNVSRAPSEEDLRLLQTLKMRSKLTRDDIVHAAEVIGDNLPALALLGDIADSFDIAMPIITAASLEEDLDRAERFSRDMLRSLEKTDEQLRYTESCFYRYPDLEDGPVYEAYHNLDTSAFTAENLKKSISTKFDSKAVIEASKTPNSAIITLTGKENLGNMLMQFSTNYEALKRANPNLDLENLKSGDKLIMPTTKMKILESPGFASVSQVMPYHQETASESESAKA